MQPLMQHIFSQIIDFICLIHKGSVIFLARVALHVNGVYGQKFRSYDKNDFGYLKI
jgi:hypothetical protein